MGNLGQEFKKQPHTVSENIESIDEYLESIDESLESIADKQLDIKEDIFYAIEKIEDGNVAECNFFKYLLIFGAWFLMLQTVDLFFRYFGESIIGM